MMKDSELILRQKTAKLLRAGRKVRGINQSQMAEILGVTQSMVSKLESATLGPDAGVWYHFCQELSLDPDLTFRSGYVFVKGKKISKKNLAFRFPKNYKANDLLVKEALPFISLIEELDLEQDFNEYCIGLKIDPDIFSVPNLLIPFDVFSKLMDYIKSNKILKQSLNTVASFEHQDLKLTGSDDNSKIEKVVSMIQQRQNILSVSQKKSSIEIKVAPDFSFSKESEVYLDDYFSLKSRQLESILKEINPSKSVDIKVLSKHHLQVSFVA